MICQLKSCGKCNGDLVLDGDEWRCWQCGQYYYPNPLLATLHSDDPLLNEAEPTQECKRRRASRRAARHINSVIVSQHRSDGRWWVKNKVIIGKLQQGLSVREIALQVGRGERQIRVVSERLRDLEPSGQTG